jgi:hypothetical protein
MATSVVSKRASGRKISRTKAARKIVTLVEQYMDAQKLSEREKNQRASRLAKRVDVVIERRAKP